MQALLLCLLSGCTAHLVKSADPAHLNDLPRIDPNTGPIRFVISEEDPNAREIHFPKCVIHLSSPCTVAYAESYFNLGLIAVGAKLPNGRTYITLLDTGIPLHVAVNPLTMKENNLSTFHLGKETWSSANAGFCYLPHLEIGPMVIDKPPCWYLQMRWEIRFLGVPVWRQRAVLIGLGLLKAFGHITFDNVAGHVVFAPEGPFEPNEPQNWHSYPLEVKDNGLTVTMPVEGEDIEMAFDTCGRDGMVVDVNTWEKLPERIRTSRTRRSTFLSGFLGKLPCRRARIRNLHLGHKVVPKADIKILPGDSPFAKAPDYISMKYFRDTAVVLDFAGGRMWVRKNGAD